MCDDPAVDIVVIAFIHILPDQDHSGIPGSNFGNACSGPYYRTPAGMSTQFLLGCEEISSSILHCQRNGKKVLLSIGGSYPGNGYLTSASSARSFADFLWGAFGPEDVAWVSASGPRPFGSSSVDGFDLDIESEISTSVDALGNPVPSDYRWQHYDELVNRLRWNAEAIGKAILISSAPQCIVPDAHLSHAIARSFIDLLFVQFYNTPGCSARDGISYTQGNLAGPDISFAAWVESVSIGRSSLNPNISILIGLVSLREFAALS